MHMKPTKVWQIVVVALVFGAALVGYTVWTNPNAPRPGQPLPLEGVTVRLWLNHLCCDGCLDDVTEALAPFPWLGKPVPQPKMQTQEQADKQQANIIDYSGYVDVPVLKPASLDLMMIDRALREEGLIANRMELGGVQRFRLSAELPHICCGMCRMAVEQGFTAAFANGAEIKWLDHVSVNKQQKLVEAHARYLAPGDGADMVEFITRLNQIGYAPTSVHVLVDEQKASASVGDRGPAAVALLKGVAERTAVRQ